MPSYWAEPSQRLLDLVTGGPLILTDDGYGMWCYSCSQIVPIRIPEASHEAIIEAAYQYGDHNRSCQGATSRRAQAAAGAEDQAPPGPGD